MSASSEILWLAVPVTPKELETLRHEAALTSTGYAWEALRHRSDLPSKPYGYVKWAEDQEKQKRETARTAE